MKRKILTFKNSLGQKEDLIPYVDGYGVVIGGTNLVDYLAQLEDTFEKSKLFLGAFESESALLSKYPDGGTYEVGTYAIVSDSDAIYIYDTDSLRWLKTASNISGIMQLNGLTPINGSLTITGGDIYSTISDELAETPNQTITSHLTNLYIKNLDNEDNVSYIAGNVGNSKSRAIPIEEDGYLTFEVSDIPDVYKKSYAFAFYFNPIGTLNNTTSETPIKLRKKFVDGTVQEVVIKINMLQYLSYGRLKETIDLVYGGQILLWGTNNTYVMAITGKDVDTQPFIRKYDINNTSWVQNEEGTGYKYTITLPTSNAQLLNVSKINGDVYTTAVIDYKIVDNVLTLYSDVQFAGNVSVAYRMAGVGI